MMTIFSTFTVPFGLLLVLGVTVAAWIFLTSTAPLFVKLVVPSALLVLACETPHAVSRLLGFPVPASLPSMPESAELVAFVAHDESHLVDLWLRQGNGEPRAYETVLDESMASVLRTAKERLARGYRVMLEKPASRGDPRGGSNSASSDEAPYELNESAFALPKKDAGQ